MSQYNNKKLGFMGGRLLGFLSLATLLVVWLTGTLYVAEQTEDKIRTSLAAQQHAPSQSFYLQLISYKRSLLTAKARTRLRSPNHQLDEIVKDLVFVVNIKHGPLIFNDNNVQLITASLDVTMDQSQLSKDAKEFINRSFGEEKPFFASVVVDYNLQYFYQLSSSAFEYEVADMRFKISAGTAKGSYKEGMKAIDINFAMDEITFKQGGNSVESMRNQVVFNLLGGSNSTQSQSQQKLHSTIAMTKEASYTGLSINLAHLQMASLFNLVDRYEDRYNLDQQIEWTLEYSTQSPEGQDRLLELYGKQDENELPEMQQLVSQLFENGSSDISFVRKVDHQSTDIAYNHSTE